MRKKILPVLVITSSVPLLLVGVVGFHLSRGAYLESRFNERVQELAARGLLPADEELAPQHGTDANVVRSGLGEFRQLFQESLPPELAGPGIGQALALGGGTWTAEEHREAERLLAPLEDAFELAHVVTSTRSALIVLEEGRPIFAGEARLMESRRWATALAARARLDALRSDHHGAAARIRDGLRLARLVDEGEMIGAMVRVATNEIFLDEVRAQLSRGHLRGGPLLEVLDRDLDRGLDAAATRETLRRELLNASRIEPVQPCPAEGVWSYVRYPSECADLLAGLAAWERSLELAEVEPREFDAALASFQESLPERDVLSAGTARSAIHTVRAHRSRTVLFEVALAAYAHQESRGNWPESLDELAVYFDGEVPVDPWNGEPFAYARGRGAFVLGPCGGAPQGDDERQERAGGLWILR